MNVEVRVKLSTWKNGAKLARERKSKETERSLPLKSTKDLPMESSSLFMEKVIKFQKLKQVMLL
jgi:hypothetical protein